jgi:hypothetical protein
MITSTQRPTPHLSVASAPRVDRRPSHGPAENPARDLAYRRLAAVILRLDVASLAAELHAARQPSVPLRHAA